MTVFIDFHSKNTDAIEEIIDSLQPCCGTCLFIDIINSTDIKYNKGLKDWMILLKNTFALLELQQKIKKNTIKFIGDAIMIFIPDAFLFSKEDLIYNYYTLIEEIYATVDMLKLLHVDEMYMKCKVSIHYCEDAYNITFFQGYDDYYGKDIDITARLLTKAKENSIIFSEKFYQKVLLDLKEMSKPKNSGCMNKISGKYIEDFKGIPFSTEFWRVNSA